MYSLYSLDKRIRRLEKLIYEKNAIRSHAPSKAFLIWKFLSKHNGATVDVIKDTFPEEQNTITTVLNDCVAEGIINIVGNKYFANKNYNWDDLGIFDDDDHKTVVNNVQYLMDRVK